MIESPNSIAPVVTGPVPQRSPQPVEQPAAVRDESARSAGPGPGPEQLRVLAERYAEPQDGERFQGQPGLELRASRAVNAYAATERMAEREYVSRFMGVDDWV